MKRIAIALATLVVMVATLVQPAGASIAGPRHQIRRTLQHRHTAFETVDVSGFGYPTVRPSSFEVRIDNMDTCDGSFRGKFDSGQLFLGLPNLSHVVEVIVLRPFGSDKRRQIRTWTVPAHHANGRAVDTPINTHCT
jgi:hypothetical protein